MNILFITPSYKPAYCYGGTTISVSELAESLVSIGNSVTVYTTNANGKKELDVPIGIPTIINGVAVYYFKRITGDHTHVSPGLWKKLWRCNKYFDIIHIQSWWSILVLGAALVCRLKNINYILSPRGMLGSYSFGNQHSFYKKMIHKLVGKRLLKTSFVHATTASEWQDCMRVHKSWKGFTLHNLINLPKVQIPNIQLCKSNVFTIGFLSRIDPKKGIELLMRALANVNFNFCFMIAGTGDEEYLLTLKSLASDLSISEKIVWVGWINGPEKFSFIKSLDLFVLTSFNENFAIAVTESLVMGTAVLISENVGLSDYVIEKNLGWVCKINIQSIQKELTSIFSNKDELIRIKEISPAIIINDFNKERLAKKYIDAYQTILNNKN